MMKNVLITGASGGIGRALCTEFAKAGYSVFMQYNKNESSAREICDEINRSGGSAAIFKADVSEEREVEKLFLQAENTFGFVGTLINNAGIAWEGFFTDMSLDEWNRLFAVNVTGAFLCCKRALPAMIRRRMGSIINVSSMWGEVGASCEVAYSAAKAALIGLTKALAKEEGISGIRVNCVAPGLIDTPMNAKLTEDDIEALRRQTPLQRVGTPEDVAKAALFLSEHSFITGQVLGVNGGFLI